VSSFQDTRAVPAAGGSTQIKHGLRRRCADGHAGRPAYNCDIGGIFGGDLPSASDGARRRARPPRRRATAGGGGAAAVPLAPRTWKNVHVLWDSRLPATWRPPARSSEVGGGVVVSGQRGRPAARGPTRAWPRGPARRGAAAAEIHGSLPSRLEHRMGRLDESSRRGQEVKERKRVIGLPGVGERAG
jgi:hypothetical protein